jgi:hypothetical protein
METPELPPYYTSSWAVFSLIQLAAFIHSCSLYPESPQASQNGEHGVDDISRHWIDKRESGQVYIDLAFLHWLLPPYGLIYSGRGYRKKLETQWGVWLHSVDTLTQ